MIYLINDIHNGKTKTIKICETESQVLEALSDINILRKIKGEIKIVKVVL